MLCRLAAAGGRVAWAVWGVFEYRKLKLAVARGDRGALIREYKLTVLGEIVGGLLAVAAVGSAILRTSPAFSFTLPATGKSVIFGGLAGLALGLVAQTLAARHKKGNGPL